MTPPARVASRQPHTACVEPYSDVRGCVEETLRAEGMAWAAGAWDCIITHESAWNPGALHLDTNGYYSRGLTQINDQWHSWRWAGKDWTNPAHNVRVAIDIWRAAGGSWRPWSTARGCGLR